MSTRNRLATLFLFALCAAPLAASAAPVFSMTLLPPGFTAHGMNNAAQAAGEALVDDAPYHAARWAGGVLTDLGTLGGAWSTANAINAGGTITGTSSITPEVAHAFVYAGGTMRDIGTLGGSVSFGIAINDAGQVVGQSADAAGNFRAFLYAGGAMTDLGTLGGDFGYAAGINNTGMVVGNSSLSLAPGSQDTHAFLYASGVMTDLGTLGGSMSSASAVNDAGQVVGNSDLGTGLGEHAYIYQDGMMTDIGSFGGRFTNALAINNAGLVVGHSEYLEPTDPFSHAFLYLNGEMIDLNQTLAAPSEWVLVAGSAINDANQILAFVCRDIGDCRSALLDLVSPIPEPAGGAMLLAGLALVGWCRRALSVSAPARLMRTSRFDADAHLMLACVSGPAAATSRCA